MIEEEKLAVPVQITTSRILKSRLSRYGPLVIWAILIFVGSGGILSAEHTSILLQVVNWLYPSASPEFLAEFHFLMRKAGHLTEYAILATLAARAFRYSFHRFIGMHWFTLSLLLAAAYSLSDEFHQSFVPSRTASIYDCMIDSVGALIALTVIWLRHGGYADESKASGRSALEH
jgi:VanZ family protein